MSEADMQDAAVRAAGDVPVSQHEDSREDEQNPWTRPGGNEISGGSDQPDSPWLLGLGPPRDPLGAKDLAQTYLSRAPQNYIPSERVRGLVSTPIAQCRYNLSYPQVRGRAVVVNNMQFTGNTPARQGSLLDAMTMISVLRRIGFRISVFENTSKYQMEKIVKNAATDPANDGVEIFTLIILSHGNQSENEQDVITTCDSQSVKFKDIIGAFTGDKAPKLAGKPKLFFVQACRGEDTDPGILIQSDSMDGDGTPGRRRDETDSGIISTRRIPVEADIYVAYSTAPGYFSWRNPNEGSWFIQCLAYRLQQGYENSLDLNTIMTLTTNDLSNFESNVPGNPILHLKKAVCWTSSTLTRLLIFGR